MRRVENLRTSHIPRRDDFSILREIRKVARRATLACTAKTPHPLWNVGLKADPRLLTIITDINPGFELALYDVLDGCFALAFKQIGIDSLSLLLIDEQIGQPRISRKAGYAADTVDASFYPTDIAKSSRCRQTKRTIPGHDLQSPLTSKRPDEPSELTIRGARVDISLAPRERDAQPM